MSKYGKRDILDGYLSNRNLVDGEKRDAIGDIISNEFKTNSPPSYGNLRFNQNKYHLGNYFSDRSSYTFKNGLEVAKNSGLDKFKFSDQENLDEDPVIFGFDFVVNHITSPLFDRTDKGSNNGTMDEFFKFAEENKIEEIISRKGIYEDFIDQFELLFISTSGGRFDTFKSHYLLSVDGLSDLINKSTGLGSTKQFSDFGKDKITLTLREDTHLTSGYLAMLYNTFSYSKINGKQIIPDNLLRFDCSIVISEIRNFKKIRESIKEHQSNNDIGRTISDGVSTDLLTLVNDNVSRYTYNLYECQFVFDKYSHPSSVKNTSIDVTDSFDISFFYKFSTMEMEKFKFSKSGSTSKYLNDGNRLNPLLKYVGEKSDNINATRRNEFINRGYQENDHLYSIFDKPTNNNISSISDNIGKSSSEDFNDMESLKSNSEELNTPNHPNGSELSNLNKNDKIDDTIKGYDNSVSSGDSGGTELPNLNKNDKLDDSIKGYDNSVSDSAGTELTNLNKNDKLDAIKGYENVDKPEGGSSGQSTQGREGGLKGVLKRSKDYAVSAARFKRNKLINDTLQNIRTATGIRRISSPINVYENYKSIFGNFKNELRSFTNDKFTGLLGGS